MSLPPRHDGSLITRAVMLSLLVHFACAVPLDFCNPFRLRPPVQKNQTVEIDLREPVATALAEPEPPAPPDATAPDATAPDTTAPDTTAPDTTAPDATLPAAKGEPNAVEPQPALRNGEVLPEGPETTSIPRVIAEEAGRAAVVQGALAATVPETAQPIHVAARVPAAVAEPPLPPVRTAVEFLADDRELLSYRISMMGISVGRAELKAEKKNGELRITLNVRSNAAFSQIYPVDDSVETRHIGGNFILSRIRQREGAFIGDKGFTLFLRDKKVFWIDRLKNTSITEPLPDSSVVDILSGLYYLRNRPLEVGKEVVLQLFDGNRYASSTVTVLGKERLNLPGLRQVDTLLIRPQLKTDGLFRRTGEILIWVTDDRNKVPVRVETRIALGKVTAELVAAESQRTADGLASEAATRTTARYSGQ